MVSPVERNDTCAQKYNLQEVIDLLKLHGFLCGSFQNIIQVGSCVFKFMWWQDMNVMKMMLWILLKAEHYVFCNPTLSTL